MILPVRFFLVGGGIERRKKTGISHYFSSQINPPPLLRSGLNRNLVLLFSSFSIHFERIESFIFFFRMKNSFSGSCYCGKIQFKFHTDKNTEDFIPRCDERQCSFCYKNDGTWISDSEGMLEIVDDESVKTQVSPSKMWKAYFCGDCGTLCYGMMEDNGERFAVIRPRALDNFPVDFSKTADTDFEGEEWDVAVARRRKNWTPVKQ